MPSSRFHKYPADQPCLGHPLEFRDFGQLSGSSEKRAMSSAAEFQQVFEQTAGKRGRQFDQKR
jgi:hypothetical protein